MPILQSKELKSISSIMIWSKMMIMTIVDFRSNSLKSQRNHLLHQWKLQRWKIKILISSSKNKGSSFQSRSVQPLLKSKELIFSITFSNSSKCKRKEWVLRKVQWKNKMAAHWNHHKRKREQLMMKMLLQKKALQASWVQVKKLLESRNKNLLQKIKEWVNKEDKNKILKKIPRKI